MATKLGTTHEVLALRYGIFDGRMQYQNFITAETVRLDLPPIA